MFKQLLIVGSVVLLLSCGGGTAIIYTQGDLLSHEFRNAVPSTKRISGDYFKVYKNRNQFVVAAEQLSHHGHLVARSTYNYSRSGQITRQQNTDYFKTGLPRTVREWTYKNGKVQQKEEQWFTRSRNLEKKSTVYYDTFQRPYLEQTWGLGDRFESSTEYYYDFKGRLDKARRNFFSTDGDLRDYWLTIYNDREQIVTEEHYLPDNSMLTFYRYTYHPVKNYREEEEELDAATNRFTIRRFNEYGWITSEVEKDRQLNLLGSRQYEYSEKMKPLFIYHYDASGKLILKEKYVTPEQLVASRTPRL